MSNIIINRENSFFVINTTTFPLSFDKLKDIFDNNKKYRVLNSPLVGDTNHL